MNKKHLSSFLTFSTLLLLPLILFLPSQAYASFNNNTVRVSVSSNGEEANNYSFSFDISDDGRFIAFLSLANNLVQGDTNSFIDAFVHDRQTHTTERVSVVSDGTQANGQTFGEVAISGDGRYVAFSSSATNLVSNDTNGYDDIFVHDRQTHSTERISISSNGTQGNNHIIGGALDISGDGRFIAFSSNASNLVSEDTNGVPDTFVHDRVTKTTERVSITNTGGESDSVTNSNQTHRVSISNDGRFIAFESPATNLVPGDTNRTLDIFVRDRQNNTTERVSVANDGSEGSGVAIFSISANGQYVAFTSGSPNLVPGDTNKSLDAFIRDRFNQTTERVSISSTGIQTSESSFSGDPSVSADGRYVVFDSNGFTLSIYTLDTYNIFIRDRLNSTTELVNLAIDGSPSYSGFPNAGSGQGKISADGLSVVFVSTSTNLVLNDTNGKQDIFVKSLLPPNQPPIANAGVDLESNEGATMTLDGSASSDPDGSGDIASYIWDFGDGTSGSGAIVNHTYADNGVYTATLTVTDSAGATSTDTAIVTINNVAPMVGEITAPLDPQQVGTAVNVSANFTDPGVIDTHSAVWDFGDGTTSTGTITEANGNGSVIGNHTYVAAGVYTLTLTVTDKDGGSGQNIFQYIVVYDPNGGFVTGGGWINSPAGAYAIVPSLSGKANFGFVSRYQNGANMPTGNTKFLFSVADFSIQSTSYDWLTVSGPKAQYKGSGSINGTGDYGFLLTTNDGQVNGGGGIDEFRIKIWDKTTGGVIYDNQMGEDDNADVSTTLGGGSIVIHN